MFTSISVASLPADSMLARYSDPGLAYTDCYSTELGAPVRLDEYIEAFYTSPIFKIERWMIATLLSKASTDVHARELARGTRDSFSAWRVEDRDAAQILLSDFRGQTRSWLMVEPLHDAESTKLYFGSAVVFRADTAGQTTGPSLVFRMLLGFHKVYSKVLLSLARRALVRLISRRL